MDHCRFVLCTRLTLVFAVAMKLDLDHESGLDREKLGILTVLVNIVLPVGVVVWWCPVFCSDDAGTSATEDKNMKAMFDMLDRDENGKVSIKELQLFNAMTYGVCV